MKISTIALAVFTTLFLSVFAATNVQAQAGTLFTVNHHGDTHDANVGDRFCADSGGNCTLRAAIEEANSTLASDAVNFALPAPSTIDLTLGQLTLSTNIYIGGPGARKLTVRRSTAAGTPQFRIFGVQPSTTFWLPTTIRGMTIKNGSVSNDGGAIYVEYQSTLQLTEVAITDNTAGGSAGAVFAAGTLKITRSLIASNTANGLFAGGIVVIGLGNSVITNSTFTNNTGGQGGAIYNAGNLTLVNNTISHNTARDAGSGVANGSTGTVNVLNTIIGMDNPAVSSLSGAFSSLGNNLITDARNSTGFTNGTNGDQVSDNNAINPLLGDLADNGGQTDTRAILAGSPAIDRGSDCVIFRTCSPPFQNLLFYYDQRSRHARFAGGTVDVGAFEYSAAILIVNSTYGIYTEKARMSGSMAIHTDFASNEKRYRIFRHTSGVDFTDLVYGEPFTIEVKSKRAGLSYFYVFDSEGVFSDLLANSEFEHDGLKFTWKN